MKNKKSLGLIALLGLAAVVFFFKDIVFTSQTFFIRDTLIQFFPWNLFKRICLIRGIIPFWNPFSHCGMPFFAGMQAGLFYPPNLIFYVTNFAAGYKVYIVFHIFIAFITMFLLMRESGLDDNSSFLAGLIFAFNGYILTRIEFLSVLGTAVWLPAAFLIVMKSRERTDFKRISALALVFTFQFLAGHPQILFYGIFAIFLYCAALRFYGGRKYTNAFVTLALGGALALMLSAVQFIPTIEFLINSVRGVGLSRQIVLSRSFSFAQIGNFFNPFLNYDDGNWAQACYVGLIAFTLFLLSFRTASRMARFYLALFAVSIFLALGSNNPLFVVILKIFPPLNAFRYPGTILYLSVFAASAGAAYALAAIAVPKKIKIFITLAVFAELFMTGQSFNEKIDKKIFTVYGDKINFLSKQQGFFRYFVSPKTVYDTVAYASDNFNSWTKWKDNLYGDSGLGFGLYNSAGQNIELADYNDFSEKLLAAGNADKAHKFLSIMSVRFLLTAYEPDSDKWTLRPESPGEPHDVRIYENKDFLPRVYFVNKAKKLPKEEILDYMASDDFNPREEVVLQKDIPPLTVSKRIEKNGKAVVTEDIINQVDVTVYAPNDVWLVMTDSFYPGWKASVNGEKAEIYKANYFQRAILVPKGSSLVVFTYRPFSFKAGFTITFFSLMFLLYKRIEERKRFFIRKKPVA